MQTKDRISAGYHQLAQIFEALENAGLQPDTDFGADITGCFTWYLSPKAVTTLTRKHNPAWMFLTYNQQFEVKLQPWDGLEGKGANIKLNI